MWSGSSPGLALPHPFLRLRPRPHQDHGGWWPSAARRFRYAPVPGAAAQQLVLLGQRPALDFPYCDPTYTSRMVVPAYELIDLNVAFTPPFTIVSK
jgi:hypothetical protein